MDFLSKLNKKVADINSEYTTTLYTDLPGFETLNTEPYVAIRDDVVSPEFCEYLIDNFDSKLTRSKTGAGEVTNIRTSHDLSLETDVWPDVDKFKSDISEYIMRDPNTMDDPTLIRYLPGESYKPHLDAMNLSNHYVQKFTAEVPNVQRILTAVIYLNDVEQGGETHFPRLEISVKAKQGRMLVFHGVHENALLPHELSLHQGLTPEQGKKYILSCWYRLTTYEKILPKVETDLTLVKQRVIFEKAQTK